MLTKAESQRLRSLRDKKQREALGLFVVEGEKVVAELMAAGYPLEKIYATVEWKPLAFAEASDASVPGGRDPRRPRTTGPTPEIITADEMARVSHFPTPSSVLAIGTIRREVLPPGEIDRGLTLALDGVQDAGNVGTLLRVADWFALDRVVLSPGCADLFHQKVINASMGSFARVRAFTAELPDVLAATKVPVLGCALTGDNVHDLPALRDAVIVIGHEGRGLSPEVEKLVTRRVTIPRFGPAESLNAAVAAAIVCDNVRRSLGRGPCG